jgi:hypothetical protein
MTSLKTSNNLLLALINEMAAAIKFLFQSHSNNEFKRLKNFISS